MLEATKHRSFEPKMDGLKQAWMLILSNTHSGLPAKEDAEKGMMLTNKTGLIALRLDWSGQLGTLHVSKYYFGKQS